MGSTYTRLNPADLARIFQPQQRIELIITKTGSNGIVEALSFHAIILKIENDQITLTLAEDTSSNFNQFRTGKVISIHTGRSDGMLIFKSKILSKNQAVRTITIETPKVMASKERRGGPRVPFHVPVVYRVLSFRSEKLHHLSSKIGTGESQNLGLGGMTIITDLKLPVGLVLALEFTLEGENLALTGIVKRSEAINKLKKSFAIGIKFIEPNITHQELIAKIVETSGLRIKGDVKF